MGTTATHAGQPLELTVNPSAVRIPEGFGTYHGAVHFINDGRAPITIHPTLVKFAGAHACTGKPVTWLTMARTAPFKLAPGHASELAYTVHAAPGVTGSVAVAGVADGPHTAAGTIGGAVGERVTVGSGAQECVRAVAAPLHQATGTSPILYLAIGLAVLLVAVGVLVARKVRQSS